MGVRVVLTVVLDPSTRRVTEKCERFLRTARLALDDGDPESAASRAYYALYHMTILLLGRVRGIERNRWDHEQLHKVFLDEFCKPHFRFSRADGDDWRYVKDSRIDADYGHGAVNERHAQRVLVRAERLITRMRQEV
jgi:uncharacterized protein (UPF0332 family)